MEDIDLNKLKERVLSKDMTDGNEQKNKLTTDEIRALAPEQQRQYLDEINAGLPRDEKYASIDEYLKEFKKKPGVPDVSKLRKSLGL